MVRANGAIAAAQGPALVRLASAIGSRFGVALSHKAAAQMVPVIGARSSACVRLVWARSRPRWALVRRARAALRS